MGVALAYERGVMGGTSVAVPLLRHFHDWAEQVGLADDPIARERMARVAIDCEVAKLLTQPYLDKLAATITPTATSSAKITPIIEGDHTTNLCVVDSTGMVGSPVASLQPSR